jgi:excisionase family DNA binding protein
MATVTRSPGPAPVDDAALGAGRRAGRPIPAAPDPYHEDDMITVAEAARRARRSVRTIRRAYLAGRLVAHRDGNGRGVTIRQVDLRAWLLARRIVAAPDRPSPRPVGQVARRKGRDTRAPTGNLELLTAARERRARAGGAGRRAAARANRRTA